MNLYTTGFSVTAVTTQLVKQANWELEVREMYSNYQLISLLLSQSTSISFEHKQHCCYLKQELTQTLEQFMSELDDTNSNSEMIKQAIFSKHVETMKKLNQSVGILISQQSHS